MFVLVQDMHTRLMFMLKCLGFHLYFGDKATQIHCSIRQLANFLVNQGDSNLKNTHWEKIAGNISVAL